MKIINKEKANPENFDDGVTKIYEEKTLKDKRQDTNKDTNFIRYAYLEEDVKQFIKEILDEIISLKNYNLKHNKRINKLIERIKQKSGFEK